MNEENRHIIFKNGRFITPGEIIEDQELLCEDGRIKLLDRAIPAVGRRVIDLKGNFLSPGLAELHIHGCGHWGFEDIDLEGFRQAAGFLLERGITAMLPTLQWDRRAVENISKIIRAYRKETGRISIPGIYIEGPFINPDKKGGMNENAVASPSRKLLAEIIEAGGGCIRIMTVAPELPAIHDITDLLIKHNVIPAFGHSNCRLEEAENLYDFYSSRGILPGMTHICNASSAVSHRDPGLAMLPFTRDTFFELNADGVHVADPMLKLLSRGRPSERMLLISDALISAGFESEKTRGKSYRYYGKEVVSTRRGVRSTVGDILSGSAALIPDVIRHYTEATGIGISNAVTAVTKNVYSFLGINGGSITPGARTDLAAFNDKLELQELFLNRKTEL